MVAKRRIQLTPEQLEEARRQLAEIDAGSLQVRRQLAAKEARDDLLKFVRLMMPDPDDPQDPDRSRYEIARHHRAIAAALEQVEAGKIPRLILAVPPRHGKSQLASKALPAWFLGRNPYQSVIAATYNQDYANDIGRDVRAMVKDPAFKEIFPLFKLRQGSAATDRLQAEEGGLAVFVGKGGAITGRGADCVVGSTTVYTTEGARKVEDLWLSGVNCRVLSYDHASRSIVFSPVQAVARREAPRVRRITTAAGRVVHVTPDHRIWCNGAYTPAGVLAPGDRLLCSVWRADREAGVRDTEIGKPGASEVLLLQSVLGEAPERADARSEGVCSVRRAGAASSQLRVRARWFWAVLFEALSVRRHGRASNRVLGAARTGLSAVQQYLSRFVARGRGACEILFARVRRPGAFVENVRRQESSVEGRSYPRPATAACGQGISGDATTDSRTRRSKVCGVRGGGIEAGSASYRQPADEQRRAKPRDLVRALSSEVARGGRWEAEEDTVALVEDLRGETSVYDLQVAGTECFFAGDVLVHNCAIIDDPIKDWEEASSPTIRDKLWSWYTTVFSTRLMTSQARIVLIQTRWHEDDLIGRITDPMNPHFQEQEARKWKIIHLPALAEENDPLGRSPGDALWPERFDREFLEAQRVLDSRGFSALYQGRPSPEEGDFFKAEYIKTYKPSQCPENLRYYVASDHAVGLDQQNDQTCLIVAGVDEFKRIWIKEAWWRRAPTNTVVEAMIDIIRRYKPLAWFAERGHISKSIGPFLRERMIQEQAFAAVHEQTPVNDKQTRAQSIQGRMALGQVMFPDFLPWFAAAKHELLTFPNATHDDFVDALAHLGLGLSSLVSASPDRPIGPVGAKPGTIAWVKEQHMRDRRAADRLKRAGGF